MGKHKFDRKKAVRFNLVPGPEKDGKPSVLFKPVETKKSKLSKKEKKTVISQLADVQQVTINGKVMEEDQIPAYVLDQIRGRSDLVYNHIHENQEEEVGDLYELQDAPGDEEYEEYQDYDFQAEGIKEEGKEDQEEEWEDQQEEQYSDDGIEITEQDEEKPKQLKFKSKIEEFPSLEEVHTVMIQGKQYKLTKKQLEMLDTIIPQNYEKMDFGGINFKKYNQDGLPISDKDKYEKYLLKDNEKVVVVDTYQYVPSKPMNFIDNDLKPSQINSNLNIREVEDALNYDGEQAIYQELEDDFFAKMILGENQEKQQPKVAQKLPKKEKEPKQVKVKEVKKVKEVIESKITEKQLQERLEKAMFNFQHNIEEKNQKKPLTESEDSEDEPDSKNNHTTSLNFQELQKKEEYIGKDGEMDWRFLTKEQKRTYMKTKIIREFEEQLREREIEEKMRGKNNVDVKDLHLKKRVDHIPFQQDHVMKKTLEDGLKQNSQSEDEDQYESMSDEDDIVSFHQKTSIIATNLSVIEEPLKKKKKKEKKEEEPDEANNITKIKVVPERRNKNETSQQRKERKNKLKEMKKEKRQQKKQFAERFTKIKKQTMKKENTNNPLNKVSYVKIY